ncbi:MAG TPA: tetratricopeptide repeat protein, partial [Planctomycetia bacterium]|nr:tetratricopeptide repeat protein [Planctomycetia bacterium]
ESGLTSRARLRNGVASGALLVEKYNKAEGIPDLQAALKINPNAAEVLVSLGASSLQDYDFAAGHRYADRALEINPNDAAALRLKADMLLADGRTPEATPFLKRARDVNPVSEATLARIAGMHILKNETKEAQTIERDVLARNPKPGVYLGDLADLLERRRQFDPAEALYRRAIAAAPYSASALNGFGILLMRVGKEDEARKVFADARAVDPYHVRVMNMVKVLKHMEAYKVVRTPHYEVMVHPEIDSELGRYMAEYLESTHAALCKRFAFEPPGRTKIEILKDHQWFSGRVVGVPSIGTVGACTGRVVALASPTSLKSKYNWARVLTHEVVHIITLEQTKFNIPHWYTEALAVLSEGYPRPEQWNDLLAERVPKGDLLNLDNINQTFVRPKTPLDWQMAYCQSLLYAHYMQERFGVNALADLLAKYAAGLETDAAIPAAFKVNKAEFEKGYSEYLKKIAAGLSSLPQTKPMSFAEAERAHKAKPDDPVVAAILARHYLGRRNAVRARELAETAIKKKADQPIALLVLARLEIAAGKLSAALETLKPAALAEKPDAEVVEAFGGWCIRAEKLDEAMTLYEKAHRLDPLRGKWLEWMQLVELKRKEKCAKIDNAKLRPILERLAAIDADNIAVRKRLAQLERDDKQWPAAERWARQILYVDVADPLGHSVLADAFAGQGKHDAAIIEFDLLMKEGDQSVAVAAARSLLAAKNPARAKKLLQERLQKDPKDEAAKALLKEAEKK